MDLIKVVDDFEETLRPKIEAFVADVLPYAMLLASGIVLIFVGYKVMRYMANPEDRLDPYAIIQPILVLAAMALYMDLVELLLNTPIDLIGEIIDKVAYKISDTSGDADAFESAFRKSITHVQSNGADGSGVYDIMQINPFLEIIHLLIYFVASVVGGYIMFRQLITEYIYLILGVFVLPFSLIIGNQKVLGSWFFGFLSVLLWLPVLKILKMIIILLPVTTTSFTDVLLSVALQLVMIFAILQVPKYANMLVSQGSSIGSNVGKSAAQAMQNGMGKMANTAMNSMTKSAKKMASKK